MPVSISLPWPDRHLSPNARVHHHVKAQYVKMAREVAFFETRSTVGLNLFTPDDKLSMVVVAHPPDNRRRDLDNIHSQIKSYQDGLFQALGLDDTQIREVTVAWGNTVHGGQVVLTLAATA